MHNPIELFSEWQRHASASSRSSHPDAVCVSTVDADGVPHARFVDMKMVLPDGFVFCTSGLSPKAQHIRHRRDVALTFWWDHVGRQIRVLGAASRMSDEDADLFFAERGRPAQLASWAFEQSAPLGAGESAASRAEQARTKLGDGEIPRPPHWGAYIVTPRRIEFLAFSSDRVHERLLYELSGSTWITSRLQP